MTHNTLQRRCAALLAVIVLALCRPAHAADFALTRNLPMPAPGGSAWTPAQIAQLDRRISRLLRRPVLRGAQVGLLAIDSDRGTLLYSRNAGQEFQPASNFKLIVGSAALDTLGPDFTFRTRVFSDGTIVDGVLHGNLYLKGGGDVHLRTRDLRDAATAVAASGITRVDGELVADASRYDTQRYPRGWDWDDLPYYYAAVTSALSLNENTIRLRITPGASVGSAVLLHEYPPTGSLRLVDRAITGPAGSHDTADLVRPWNHPHEIVVVGSYPLGRHESGDLAPAVPDPAIYALDVFARALTAHGITIEGAQRIGTTPNDARLLWQHRSEPMPALLADMWQPSDNLMAETFLKELGVVEGGMPGTTTSGISLEQRWLRGIGVNPATVAIVDGSGLSNYDRITPRALVAILQHDWDGPHRGLILDALPVAGVVGTLQDSYVGSPAARNVWAKTGTISHVSTISGFIRTRYHGAVTFSLLVNDWVDPAPGADQELGQLRARLFSSIVTAPG
ncbi:MAG: D-alanyl-D-alanine carboxypeptidase/D-alanyl-D-alanine endopeptidase [Vulcanimicrobiaceae bacterium]